MLTKLKVPYVMHNGNMVVIGEAAFELANIFSRETRRPMKDGLISPNETDALQMIKLLIAQVLGQPNAKGENCYFSVPAESVDADNNVVYHQGLFESMLRNMGYTARAINEGHAVVFSELAEQDFTGIGISFGGGMVNVCVSYKTIPAFSFSVARGGDWIDKNVANVLGINRSKATSIKERGINVAETKSREEEAVAIYYRNLIAYTMQNIKMKFEQTKNLPSFPATIDICCAGGTSLIGGFIELFRDEFQKINFPIPVGKIFRAEEALNSVAKGCLVAAAISE
jgi:actin-like ATPase involved in cell morphogenesis